MRVAITAMAPALTLPMWTRSFRRSVLPMVDACRFAIGTPLLDLMALAERELAPFATLTVQSSYHRHAPLNALFDGLADDDEVVIVEDDCYLACSSVVIDELFVQLDKTSVIAARLPRDYGEPARGILPCMCFAVVGALRSVGLDWSVADGGDPGWRLGCRLEDAGVKIFNLPQFRLARFPGNDLAPDLRDALVWPWVHTGEGSYPQTWLRPEERGVCPEALAAFAVAFERGEALAVGPTADRMRDVLAWAESDPRYGARYEACKAVLRRVVDCP